MLKTRRLATLGLSVVVAGVMAATPASAQTGATYGGTANADALTISLFGQTLTTSAATAEVDSSPLAKATATQVLTPAFTGGPYTAETSAPNTSVRDPENPEEPCNLADLSQIPGVTRSDVSCGFAEAALTEAGGSARGLGAEVVLEPSVSQVLDTLQLGEPVREGTDQLFEEAISPIVEGLSGNPVGDLAGDGVETIQDVLNGVLSFETTARIVVAPALAEVTVADCLVNAHAQAQGVRIELLPAAADAETNGLMPADLEVGEPLLTITLGAAEVTKSVPCDGGEATADAKGSTAIINVGTTALLETLGLAQQEVSVEVGETICVLEGTPLETCVTLASAGVDADGNPFADGTSVQALKGVNGGIDLALGRAGATGAGEPAPAEQPAAAPQGELPRTGGPAAVPVAGAGLLALAAAARHLASRRRS